MVEVSLVYLFILLTVLFFILLSIFLYLMIKKYINRQTRLKIDEIKEIYRLNMFHYLQTGKQELLERDESKEKFTALIELLSEYSAVLKDAGVKERISLFAKQYLSSFIKIELKQRRWSLRMNALYTIEDFYMDHLVEILHDLYHKKSTTIAEKSQLLLLFAKFHDDKMIDYFKVVNEKTSNFTLLSILSQMEEEKFDELVCDFHDLSERIRYSVIETIGKKQLIKHHHFLQNLLIHEDREVRIRALKAFANTGFPINVEALTTFLESTSWQVRMMATKVVGVQRVSEYKEKLIELLSDQEYIVRAEAAKAILRFNDGERVLLKVIEETNDLFAKDMAIEWLEKERGGYSY